MSKKNKINQEELLNDVTKVFKLIDKLDTADLENIDAEKLEKDVDLIKKELTKKYKEHIPKEGLDSVE
jgi:hypothetical protein